MLLTFYIKFKIINIGRQGIKMQAFRYIQIFFMAIIALYFLGRYVNLEMMRYEMRQPVALTAEQIKAQDKILEIGHYPHHPIDKKK
jgi:hypothetical protein